MTHKISINQFSNHLFWDVKRDQLDIDKNKEYIIWQVLEYGKLTDWKLIREYYGILQIAKIAMNFRTLDTKSLSFISLLSGIPKEKFKCYTFQQSVPPHWNF